jgi:hypothetical protein
LRDHFGYAERGRRLGHKTLVKSSKSDVRGTSSRRRSQSGASHHFARRIGFCKEATVPVVSPHHKTAEKSWSHSSTSVLGYSRPLVDGDGGRLNNFAFPMPTLPPLRRRRPPPRTDFISPGVFQLASWLLTSAT